jgi:hypothetical protein
MAVGMTAAHLEVVELNDVHPYIVLELLKTAL